MRLDNLLQAREFQRLLTITEQFSSSLGALNNQKQALLNRPFYELNRAQVFKHKKNIEALQLIFANLTEMMANYERFKKDFLVLCQQTPEQLVLGLAVTFKTHFGFGESNLYKSFANYFNYHQVYQEYELKDYRVKLIREPQSPPCQQRHS